jgi:hypothetical protein
MTTMKQTRRAAATHPSHAVTDNHASNPLQRAAKRMCECRSRVRGEAEEVIG